MGQGMISALLRLLSSQGHDSAGVSHLSLDGGGSAPREKDYEILSDNPWSFDSDLEKSRLITIMIVSDTK